MTEEVSSCGDDPEPFIDRAPAVLPWSAGNAKREITSEPMKSETLREYVDDGNMLVPDIVKDEDTSDLVSCWTQALLVFAKRNHRMP